MRFSTASSSLFLTAGALLSTQSIARAVSPGQLIGCPSAPTEELRRLASEVRLEEFDSISAQEDVSVNMYLHVIATNQQEMDTMTDDVLDGQLSVLNEVYEPLGFSFSISDVTRDVNPDIAYADLYPADWLTRDFRQGNYADLNVYLMTDLGGFDHYTTLGYAQFPQDVSSNSTVFYRDGVAILSSTVPGGSFQNYNSGKNLVHEVGHWLGLFHTFEGGCNGGDMVDDTPAQASASDGTCISDRDTCPYQSGYDPVNNYMDYSSEPCKTEFTQGQITRMHSSWSRFRAGKQAVDGFEGENLHSFWSRQGNQH